MVQPVGKGGTPVIPPAVEEQQELLAKIQVIKFAGSPANVEPFQNTTVSYQVKLPAGLEIPLTYTVDQKTLGHGVEGSGTFAITASTTFQLYVATSLTGKGDCVNPGNHGRLAVPARVHSWCDHYCRPEGADRSELCRQYQRSRQHGYPSALE